MTPSTATDTSTRAPRNFPPFTMSGDGCEGTEEAWSSYHSLLYALKDAHDDLRFFDRDRHEMRELLRETGFHAVARLRKQADFHAYEDEEFDTILEALAEAGYSEIALKAEAARTWQIRASGAHVPKASTEAKKQLIAKLERLATSSNSNEAASANARIEEIKAKYEIDSSDSMAFDLDELDAPFSLTPTAELAILLNQVWQELKPLGDIYYDLQEEPEQMRSRLQERVKRLEKLVREHQLLKRTHPVVQRRR